MKKYAFTLCAVFALAIPLFGQEWAETGTRWYYDMSGDGTAPYGNSQYDWYESVGDTIYLDEICKIIRRNSYLWQSCDTTERSPLFTFERNDTVFMSYGGKPFFSMYIMNVRVGDTITIGEFQHQYTVDSITQFLFNNTKLKQFHLTMVGAYWMMDNYIELLGSNFKLEMFRSEWPVPERPGPIRCFENSLGAVNFNPGIACTERKCNTSNTLKINPEAKFQIYPNPAKEFISIKSESNGIVEIFNVQGKLVLSFEIPNVSHSISLSSLSNGLYLIQFRNAHGRFAVEKLIIQR